MKTADLLYSKKTITIRIPDSVDILENSISSPAIDTEKEIKKALKNPIGTASLETLLERKKPNTVAITISDITRPVPNREILPYILKVLRDFGVKKNNISIIIGTGMHRASTPEERYQLVGEDIKNNYAIFDHDSADKSGLVNICDKPRVSINKNFIDADFKIVTGFIEPHFMAGFSGGRKGVCPAMVDLDTIQKFHGFETLASDSATAGVLNGNPCHEAALKIAKLVDIDFLFNVTLNRDFQISSVFCGDLEAAHKQGCAFVSDHATCTIEKTYDLVVTCGGGYPLDINYYQSVKGMCMALPALHSGSTLLQVSKCREGVGSEAFKKLIFSYDNDWRRFLRDIEAHKNETLLDQWEFQMLCRVLKKIDIEGLVFYSEGIPIKEQGKICCTPLPAGDNNFQVVNDYIRDYIEANPKANIAVIPSGPYTIVAGKRG
jgi:lactate racemase